MASANSTVVHISSASSPQSSPTSSSNSNSPYKAYIAWQRVEYPNRVWYCVAFGILLFILANIWAKLRCRARRSTLEHQRPSFKRQSIYTGPISLRRLPIAIGSAWDIAAYRWTVPYGKNNVLSLTELLATMLYAAILFTWSFIDSNGGQEQFWAQRTGNIAFTQIPLLTLLAGKNNLLTLVTGISYDTLNIMHRAAARVQFVLILLHSFTKVPFSPAKLITERYLTGVVGSTAFGAIFLFSLRPVRANAFELFLILHICLAGLYLTCSYLHQPKLGIYIWVATGFTALDRLHRVFRLIFINSRNPTPVKAVIEHVSSDAMRITLPNRHINWSAGQHVFLTLPGISNLLFESHPFTIASIREPTTRGYQRQPLVFIIRAVNGFTRHLYNYAASYPGKPVTVLVDGPYGRPPPVNTFSTVVLLAGGSGVSFTLPLLLDIISAAKRHESPVRRVLFVWAVKRRDDIKWAYDDIKTALKALPRHLSVDVRIHITQTTISLPISDTNYHYKKKQNFPLYPMISGPFKAIKEEVPMASADGIQISMSRPHLLELVREEVEYAQGPVSVNASGPLSFTNNVRAICRADFAGPMAVLRGAQPITLYTEGFGGRKKN